MIQQSLDFDNQDDLNQNQENQFADDMQSEELEKSEHFPPEGSKRWKEIYGKMKQYERELEAVRSEKESLKELVEEMKNFNKQLASSINKGQEEVPIEVTLKELKSRKKEALESADFDTAEELNEQIVELKLRQMLKKDEKKGNEAVFDEESSKELHRFITTTEWYKNDPEMRLYANQLDAALLQDPNWLVRPVRERLAEVKRRVEKRFNYTKQTIDKVDSSNYTGSKSSAVNKLSENERRLAEAFGMTAEEWLKQKSFITGGKHG